MRPATTAGNGTLSVVVVANRTSVDLGQLVGFTIFLENASGGPWTYTWIGLPSSCGTDGVYADCTADVPGTLVVRAEAVETGDPSVAATSPPVSVAVDALPVVTIVGDTHGVDVWVPLVLTARASFGSGGYGFDWTGIPPGCAAFTNSLDCVAAGQAIGNYTVAVGVTDSNGGAAQSAPIPIAIAPALFVPPPRASGLTVVGQPVDFAVAVGGGLEPISVTWRFGDASGASGPAAVHAYGAPGSYAVTVWVNDSGGGALEQTIELSIHAPSTGLQANAIHPPSTGIEVDVAYLVAAGALVLVVLGRFGRRDARRGRAGRHARTRGATGSLWTNPMVGSLGEELQST